ncbi:unnamed protein product, partial [Brassica rapa subsp. narinosa]
MRRMSSISCSGSSTSFVCSSCNGGSSPLMIRPRAKMKGSNLLYRRPPLTSTTPNLLDRTPLLTT